MKLHLSPEVKLRPDGGRAVLFSVNSIETDGDEVCRFLYPQQAIILALFDGTKKIRDIKKLVSFLFNLTDEGAAEQIKALLALPVNSNDVIGSLLLETDDTNAHLIRTYDPGRFVVPADEIDMRDVRCKTPIRILVLPTMQCVTNCIYCYADTGNMQGRKQFGLDLFKKLLRELKECAIETVDFSGGDFFCRADAFELLEATFQEGLYPTIPTKMPLTREVADRLASIGLKTIQISIDAVTPDLIDKLMQRRGYGSKILDTIDYLGEAGIKVRTNTVLTPLNIQDVPALITFLAKRPFVFKISITCYGRSLYRHDDALFVGEDSLHEFEENLNTIKMSYPQKRITFSGANTDYYVGTENEKSELYKERALCTANRRGVVVLPDGQVTVCEELYFHPGFIIGDLNKNSLLEVWNSAKAMELAHPSQESVSDGPCKTCPDYRECHDNLGRCYREALKAYGYEKPHWPDPRCSRAPRGRSFVAR
jgi:radical SAM protein with 4Fe4S-binding SPASM domain